MRLSTTVNYLSQLIEENSCLIAEVNRSKRIWILINFLLRYPALVIISISGVLTSYSITNLTREIQIVILVLTLMVSVLNTTHAFLLPDSQITASNSVCCLLEGLNSDLRMAINVLSSDSDLMASRAELDNEDIRRYLLIITKFELNRTNILKSMPSRLFVRGQKIKNGQKKSAFDVTPETRSSELAV